MRESQDGPVDDEAVAVLVEYNLDEVPGSHQFSLGHLVLCSDLACVHTCNGFLPFNIYAIYVTAHGWHGLTLIMFKHMRHYHMIYCTKKEQILYQKGTESKKG
jgi:hypothetical protein